MLRVYMLAYIHIMSVHVGMHTHYEFLYQRISLYDFKKIILCIPINSVVKSFLDIMHTEYIPNKYCIIALVLRIRQ